MANRIVYSCNSSDMDVSDTDDGAQISQQEGTTPLLPELFRDTLKLRTEEYDSDSSYYTARNSPTQLSEELEPGQISDASHIANKSSSNDPLELECRALESQLKANKDKISFFDQELKLCKDREEQIKIQLLEYEVRNSIARNRRPAQRERVTPAATPPSHSPVTAPVEISVTSNLASTIDLPEKLMSVNPQSAPAKSLVPNKSALPPLLQPSMTQPFIPPFQQSRSQYANCRPDQDIILPPVIPSEKDATPTDTPVQIAKRSNRKRSRRRKGSMSGGSESEGSAPEIPPPIIKRKLKHPEKQVDFTKTDSPGRQRLREAVIDVPLSTRYVLQMARADASDDDADDDNDNDSNDEGPDETVIAKTPKKKGKQKANPEDLISDEEKALIASDIPPYKKPYTLSREDYKPIQAEVSSHLRFNPPSMKSMRITLLNLQETSIKQNHRLSRHQEEFVKGLVRKLMRLIEDYMILPEEVYRRPLRLQPPVGNGPERLPDHYYGLLGSLKYTDPDISHHELYKTVKYFQDVVTKAALRKIDQFLLTSGRSPNQRVIRTCDPANPDRTSNIPFDMHMKNNPEVMEMLRKQVSAPPIATPSKRLQKKKESKAQKKRRLIDEQRLVRERKARERFRLMKEQLKSEPVDSTVKPKDTCPSPGLTTVTPITASTSQPTQPDDIDINQLYEFYANKVKQEPMDTNKVEKVIQSLSQMETPSEKPIQMHEESPAVPKIVSPTPAKVDSTIHSNPQVLQNKKRVKKKYISI